MGRLTIVGEAPAGYGQEALPALEGLVGRRLARMMGITYGEYLTRPSIRRKNIFEVPDEARPWDHDRAYVRAGQLLADATFGEKFVLLGAKVSRAFGVAGYDPYEWVRRERASSPVWVARVPHPSGRNRVLNDAGERHRMSGFLQEALRVSS
jgi:uracil-DNA glycosylase